MQEPKHENENFTAHFLTLDSLDLYVVDSTEQAASINLNNQFCLIGMKFFAWTQ